MRSRGLPKKSATLIAVLAVALVAATSASAQKKGGTLRLYHNDNPPSTSLLEEATIASVMPSVAVFNNLAAFDPAKPQERLETIIPDPAESWTWDSTNTNLTFKLRSAVKWHDAQPFTATDVQCTGACQSARPKPGTSKAARARSGTRNCRTSASPAITRRRSN